MSILDKIKQIVNGKTDTLEDGIKRAEIEYQETETKEEAIKKAKNQILREIKENPKIKENPEIAATLMKMVEESETLPKEVAIEAVKSIPDIEQIKNPEEVVIQTIRESNLGSRDIKGIIKESDVSIETAKEMAKEIPDEELRKEELERLEAKEREIREEVRKRKIEQKKQQLKKIYITCNNKNDFEFFESIRNIKNGVNNKQIKEIIAQVLARKAAISCKHRGIAKIETMSEFISPEEMLEIKFDELVGQEFEEIKGRKEYPGKKEFEKETLLKLILKEVARNVAKIYLKTGIMDIPQSEKMNNLSPELEEYFIRQIEIFKDTKDEKEKVEEVLEEIQIEREKEQISSLIKGESELNLEELIKVIKKIPEQKISEYASGFKYQIKRGWVDKRLPEELEDKLHEVRGLLDLIDEDQAIEILNRIEKEIVITKEENEKREQEKKTDEITIEENSGGEGRE